MYYAYIHIYIHMYIYIYGYSILIYPSRAMYPFSICKYVCIYIYIYMYACMHACMHVCMYILHTFKTWFIYIITITIVILIIIYMYVDAYVFANTEGIHIILFLYLLNFICTVIWPAASTTIDASTIAYPDAWAHEILGNSHGLAVKAWREAFLVLGALGL